MLVLTRKDGEAIILHTAEGDVEITFLGNLHGHYKIGLDAPNSINIVRKELIGRDRRKGGNAL